MFNLREWGKNFMGVSKFCGDSYRYSPKNHQLNLMVNDYYTYAYLREDRTPYYIGKGRGRRVYSSRRLVKAPKDKSRIIFLKKGLTEQEAFKHEVYMIAILGRKDLGTGILRNHTNGGEGSSGHVKSEEWKKTHSKKMTGENHPQFGIPQTETQKKAQSERMSGEKHPQFGKIGALSPKSKAVIAVKPDGPELHYGSIIDAANDLGINQSNLCNKYLKTGKSPTRGKFKGWRFVYENS